MNISLAELAKLLSVSLPEDRAECTITGFASLREARKGDLSFFSDQRYRQRLSETKASVVLLPKDWTLVPDSITPVFVDDPSSSFETVVEAYGFHASPPRPGIHPSAFVAEGVTVDRDRVSIGPHAVIEEGACIGHDVEIGAGCFVGRSVHIGNGCKLFANSTIHEGCMLGENVILHSSAVIGADGFGYEFIQGRHRKVRQSGIVQIDDDVEIGAGTMVDRARFGRTWIGEGTKIDNLVQIGHNVVIGKHCIIVAGTAIAGSALIGDYVIMAAQVGVAGHVVIGSQCTIAARSGVTKDLPAGPGSYMGFPAVPAHDERRRIAGSRRLPELLNRVKSLEALVQPASGAS